MTIHYSRSASFRETVTPRFIPDWALERAYPEDLPKVEAVLRRNGWAQARDLQQFSGWYRMAGVE